jgi:hypothetical protein
VELGDRDLQATEVEKKCHYLTDRTSRSRTAVGSCRAVGLDLNRFRTRRGLLGLDWRPIAKSALSTTHGPRLRVRSI